MINRSEELAAYSTQLALSKKAEDIVILDVRDLTSIADFFVICSGDSDTQIKAIADAILDGLEKEEVKVWHVEGYNGLRWVLLDYVDFVIHIFQKDVRPFYNLERLWGDAKTRMISSN